MAVEQLIDDIESELAGQQDSNIQGLSDDIEKHLEFIAGQDQPSQSQNAAAFVGQYDLGEPGLKDIASRFAFAQGNTKTEKVKSFLSLNPDGELFQVPGTKEYIFRKNPSEPFRFVEGPEFEPILDVVDFLAEDAGALAGEVLMTIGTQGKNFLATIGRMFLGGSVGEMAQQGVQELSGVNEEGFDAVAGRSFGKGVVSSIGGGFGYGIGKLFDIGRGSGALGLKEGAPEAMAAIERLNAEGAGLKPLTPGQASDNPLVQKIEGQAGATTPTIKRYIDQNMRASVNFFNRMRDKAQAGKLRGTLTEVHEKLRNEILSQAKSNKTSLTRGGESLSDGIAKYDDAARFVINEKYNAARSIESPSFNISQLKSDAAEVGFGIKGQKAPIKKPSTIVDDTGKPLGEILEDGGTVQLSGDLSPDLMSVIRDISELDLTLPATKTPSGDIVTPTEQLRALQQRLWDLKTTSPGELKNNSHRLASILYRSVTETLKNPTNKNQAFVNAWADAGKEASKRFDTMEKLIVMEAVRSETPAQLAFRLAQPRQVDNLRTLRSTIPPDEYARFQDSFKTDLLNNPDKIGSRLDSFDKPTLDQLLSPAEQTAFRRVSHGLERLKKLNISGVVENQSRVGGLIRGLIQRSDTASIDMLAEIVRRSGGHSSPLGKQIRAGVMESVAREVLVKVEGRIVFNERNLTEFLRGANSSGMLRFLTLKDVKTLKNLEQIAPYIQSGVDTGTSLQAAEVAAGFRGVLTGDVKGGAIRHLLENMGMGNFLTSRFAQKLLVGSGKEKLDKAPIALVGAALSTVADDVDKTTSDVQRIMEALKEKSKYPNGG